MLAALLSLLVLLVVGGLVALGLAIAADDRHYAEQVHDLGVATPPHDQGRSLDFDYFGRPL